MGAIKAPASGDSALGQLEQALADEHHALLHYDIAALITATEHKLHALQTLERNPPIEQGHYLRELAGRNRANGLLLTRRRREMDWALRYLGRSEHAAYDAKGQAQWKAISKPLAVV